MTTATGTGFSRTTNLTYFGFELVLSQMFAKETKKLASATNSQFSGANLAAMGVTMSDVDYLHRRISELELSLKQKRSPTKIR
jgi:hypothetical protein